MLWKLTVDRRDRLKGFLVKGSIVLGKDVLDVKREVNEFLMSKEKSFIHIEEVPVLVQENVIIWMLERRLELLKDR